MPDARVRILSQEGMARLATKLTRSSHRFAAGNLSMHANRSALVIASASISSSSGTRLLSAGALGEEFYVFYKVMLRRYVRLQERQRQAIREHLGIIDALHSRDSELAEFLMRRHIKGAREAFDLTVEAKDSEIPLQATPLPTPIPPPPCTEATSPSDTTCSRGRSHRHR